MSYKDIKTHACSFQGRAEISTFGTPTTNAMMRFEESELKALALHKVGNKSADEGVVLSSKLLEAGDVIKPLLLQYFLSPFRSEELYNFAHPSELDMNEVYHYASAIFENPGCLLEQSQNLAQHLYRQSTHPKIKNGEFYVAFFENCRINDETVNAIGLFKSESRETYLKIYPVSGSFEIGHDDGININKLDKGCLIFNTGRDDGFAVAIVDTLNKGSEAQYWRDNFLQVTPRADNYHNTRTVMDLCKKFVTDKLPQDFEVSRADQADMLNRSMKFLKENESFEMEEFNEQVLSAPAIINSFSEYKNQFGKDYDLDIPENFQISESAVKSQSRFMKSVIKLDKNFHIYIHGEKQMVEKGYDEVKQLNYYKLFFKEEN
jgi:hypothetical protein